MGEELLYCHWQDVYDYMMEFKERAEEVLGGFSEEAVLHYVPNTEELIRAAAIDLCRGPPQLPWGQALKQAVREQSHYWVEARENLLAGPGMLREQREDHEVALPWCREDLDSMEGGGGSAPLCQTRKN